MTYFTRLAFGDQIPPEGLGSTAFDIGESLLGKFSFMKMNNYLVDFSIARFDVMSDLTRTPKPVRIACDDWWMGYDRERNQYYCQNFFTYKLSKTNDCR